MPLRADVSNETPGTSDKSDRHASSARLGIHLNIVIEAACKQAIDGYSYLSGVERLTGLHELHTLQISCIHGLSGWLKVHRCDNFAAEILSPQRTYIEQR